MSKYLIDSDTLTDIADAIREQTGESGSIQVSQMASQIEAIQGGGSVDYSTTEHEVGTWIDGSTIYEKTIYNSGGQSGEISIAHGITDLDNIISFTGFCYDDGWGEQHTDSTKLTFPCNTSAGEISIRRYDGTNIVIIIPSAYSARIIDIYISLTYTKTSVT